MAPMPRADANPDLPLVSIVLPVKNEATYLQVAVEHLQRQTYPADRIEILVVDGGSTDGTLAIAQRLAAGDPRISLHGGPGVNCPMAMNVGIAASRGTFIAKIDGHGYVNPTYVEAAVTHMLGDATIGCVGGRIRPIGSGPVQRANMIARFSILGVGPGIYTAAERIADVDTVQCGIYRRTALETVGGFDDALQFGEDEEVNYRIRKAGFRILFDPALQYSYYVRPTIASLGQQYRNYGLARVRVVRKHPGFFSPKHAAPATLLGGLATTGIVSVVTSRQWRIPASIALLYALFLVAGGVALSVRHQFGRPDLVMASLAALHVGYGIGTIRGLFDWLRGR